ncbi:MAG: transglycosylase SLT domain-containing protein [Phyllobacteriaceae bacterium]|jgi:soluble lytic murein transglycosylase|nr:transglycosylase SLT domain-containing protein [Phyllobacteriaceae bacterium]
MELNQKLMAGLASLGIVTLAGFGALTMVGPQPTQLADRVIAHDGVDPIVTASVPAADNAEHNAQIARLGEALTAIGEGRIADARSLRDAMLAGSVDRDLVDWTLAASGDRAVGAGAIAKTMRRLADWPGQALLARNHERALARGWLGNIKLRTVFDANPPETFEAAYALAKGHLRTGGETKARDLVVSYWRTMVLSSSIDREVLDLFDGVLTQADHRARYVAMMVRERIRAGGRIAEASGMDGLHEAWAAVIRKAPGVDALIADVPDALLDTEAGLYMRIEHLRRTNRMEDAADLLAEVASDPAKITAPDAWWNERRIVSRSLREAGAIEQAYEIVAKHRGGSPATEVDAAFHSGWYALRGLNDPARAKPHFERIEQIAQGAASRARGAYWLGRAAGVAGDEDMARAHFERAASYPTSFYGQLAGQALGHERLAIGPIPTSEQARRDLSASRVLMAIERQTETGAMRYLQTLYQGLAEHFDTPAHYAALAAHAAERGHHAIGLRVAKRGQWNGHDLGIATHPADAIPSDGFLSASDRALVYAVARQESEFNTNAVSRANARGLLQLLPSTARDVAGRMDLAYSASRLTADPAFNALLGTQYLDEQRDRFSGSHILTFIAYNAGSGRAREWIGRFGDPRGLPLDETIDWIEQIPFPETRLYVQKVMANMAVYKAQFGLPLTISQDLTATAG